MSSSNKRVLKAELILMLKMSELFEQPNLTETMVEDENLEDFKKSLVPLTEDEAAAVAKSKDETAKADPKPSNYDDDESEFSSLPPQNTVSVFENLRHAGLITGTLIEADMKDIASGESEESKGCSKFAFVEHTSVDKNAQEFSAQNEIFGEPTLIFDSFSTKFPSADMDKVMAANTFDGGSAFSTFQNDPLLNILTSDSISVKSQKDSFGKTYYYFDNGINANTCVVVFEVGGQTMVKISNAILRLDTLLSLEQCVVQPQTKPDLEKTNRGLGQIPLFDFHGSVECTFGDDAAEKLVVSDISIDLMMNVVAYLSQVYSPQVETQQQQEHTPVIIEKAHNPQEESDDCALILFSTISIAVLMNLLMTFILWQSSISGGYYNLKREYN